MDSKQEPKEKDLLEWLYDRVSTEDKEIIISRDDIKDIFKVDEKEIDLAIRIMISHKLISHEWRRFKREFYLY